MSLSKSSSKPAAESKNWYKDRYETVVTQRNFLSIIALVSLGMALITVLIILYLVPAKTVMPFLIQVDDKSGMTTIIDPETRDVISADESLRKYFVVKFIKARESYDSTDNAINANIVRLLGARGIYRKYWQDVVSPSNSESLYQKLGADELRLVHIRSIQFLDGELAQVRFSILERKKDESGDREIREDDLHYLALVSFTFENLELELEDLMVNPLGFRVTEYRVDEDSFR